MPGTTDVEATLGLPDVLRLVGEDVEVPGPDRRQRYVDRRHRIPGAVRASMGLATTAAHVDRLLSALAALAADGTRVDYVFDEVENEYRAAGERPSWPDVPFRLRTPATGSSR
jgi:hypothetical protein